jgi:DNA-binding beta-propeller fold protein YncE
VDGLSADPWGSIYTPDYNNSCVYKYSNTGAYQCKIGSPGNGPGQLGTVSCGVCVDKKGVVYVTDFSNQRVSEFTTTGAYLCEWGNSGPNALGQIDFLCTSPSGQVYVADYPNVKIFGP